MRLRDVRNRYPQGRRVVHELLSDWTCAWTPRDWDPTSMPPVGMEDPSWDIPAGLPALRELFEGVEPGAGAQLDRFIAETK